MRRPSVFVAHGAPTIAIERDEYTSRLQTLGESLRGARAIVIASAHWQTRGGTRVNAVERPETIYDFGGFSDELYSIRYDAPGDPALAREVASLIGAPLETARGWDHGVWTPLVHVCSDMSMPIVEISLPLPATPRALLDLGRALAPLRDENVVIAGSGGIVHNLSLLNLRDKNAPPDSWAVEFDEWIAARIEARDFDELAMYRERAPHAERAVPTAEHLEPLFIVCGASRDDEPLQTIYAGFHYGSLSLRSIAFGNI
jgi:4,5-DOPA dioxygenase extradiol